MGRWLLTHPDILMLDEPTRGIDIGAKFEIYQLIADLAKRGKSVIMISSEMPELLGVSDRILVMSAGKVAGIVETAKLHKRKFCSCRRNICKGFFRQPENKIHFFKGNKMSATQSSKAMDIFKNYALYFVLLMLLVVIVVKDPSF